jgi:GT2 family glycosyltransferase
MIKQVSIIIVNYNTKNFLHDCLFSIYKHTKDISFEIIVSDNGSIDGSIEMLKSKFPEVVLIENKKNIGFGAANNKGLNIAQGKYIFYLNSDTVLLNNAVKIFHDFWENYSETDELGALGCNLQDMQGNIIHSYGTFPDLNKEILLLFYTIINCFVKSILFCIGIRNINIRKNNIIFYTGQVEYITGADLFLRNNIFACFDERFFLYSEEADLEYILKKIKKNDYLSVAQKSFIWLVDLILNLKL